MKNSITNLIKAIWLAFKGHFLFFKKQQHNEYQASKTTSELAQLNHSCALTSLSRAMPNLSYEEISNAFYNCCDEWPSDGVTHKEFNIVLRYLNVFEYFIYKDESKNNKKLSDYFDKEGVYILLILGHYTVFSDNKIHDSHGYKKLPKNTKIYCSWLFSTGK